MTNAAPNATVNRWRDPLTLSMTVLAVIGWGAVILIWVLSSREQSSASGRLAEIESERARLTTALQQQQETSGTAESLRTQIASGQQELSALTAQRESVQSELDAASARLQGAEAELTARNDELSRALAELETTSESVTTSQRELTVSQESLAQSTAELSAVGARLESARADEAAARQTLAQLSTDAAASSQQVADLERRLQQAREADAGAQQKIDEARRAQEELAQDRAALEDALAELEVRRGSLAEEVARAEQERTEIQTQITGLADTLAGRGSELAALEARIAEAQLQAEAAMSTSTAGLSPGNYIGRAPGGAVITASFGADGTFTMSRGGDIARAREDIVGRFSIEDNSVTFTEASGDLGAATFPMTCATEPTPNGFLVSDEASGCALQGTAFTGY